MSKYLIDALKQIENASLKPMSGVDIDAVHKPEMIELSPMAIVYLTFIHMGVFDQKLHLGMFKENKMHAAHVNMLLHHKLITYKGVHFLTEIGREYTTKVLGITT